MKIKDGRIFAIGACMILSGSFIPVPAKSDVESAEFPAWIKAMITAPRGPFSQILWFCEDGVTLPPKPYSCSEHGGGVQHGQWSKRAETLRTSGFRIANVLIAIDPEQFYASSQWRDDLAQILVERFLINYDDGWIFRGARFYRGALQAEDEAAGAKFLLENLFQIIASSSRGKDQDFLLLREAVRLLPREREKATVTTVRNLASRVAESDSKFSRIRIKIHNQPDNLDARRVREYGRESGDTSLHEEYEKLAHAIEQVYAPTDIKALITRFARTLKKGALQSTLLGGASDFDSDRDDETRLKQAAALLRHLRESYPYFQTNNTRLATLELSLQLELEAFTAANKLAEKVKIASRSQRLHWLRDIGSAVYGIGLISQREWDAFNRSIDLLAKSYESLGVYRTELRYLNRLPGWATHWLKFHFGTAVDKLAEIEPLTRRFIPDRLRSSPLLAYGQILNGLLVDANILSGTHHQLFGKSIGSGLRPLNPGLARGILHLAEQGSLPAGQEHIVLLPETTAELPPVAGILTMGEGNSLSHVQLLASNLGIPNVVISENLQLLLEPMLEQSVVLAVSPGGIVQLEADGAKWHEYFSHQMTPESGTISPDMKKLNLQQRWLIPLADLRAADAGRIAGPKAANLGELKHFFPEAVTSGLVIPFGVFREFLNQPYPDSESTVFQWMQSEYGRIKQLNPERRSDATRQFLGNLRDWILNADPGLEFLNQLAKSLSRTFGKNGSYAVFVRSDTNVEDLPGFTGAGLNLTVPNVTGINNIVKAILQVWASPFSDRAFAWRQRRMSHPEHVYPSVLLLKSVPVDKSGVMLTVDTETGNDDALIVAVNFGIGGAVQGQSAEELSIHPLSGDIRVLADATAATQRVLSNRGGLINKQLPADGRVLTNTDIRKLIDFANELIAKFPQYDDTGKQTPADVEFGFKNGELVLFQVRPYLQNKLVKKNHYLNLLDQSLNQSIDIRVDMDAVPNS